MVVGGGQAAAGATDAQIPITQIQETLQQLTVQIQILQRAQADTSVQIQILQKSQADTTAVVLTSIQTSQGDIKEMLRTHQAFQSSTTQQLQQQEQVIASVQNNLTTQSDRQTQFEHAIQKEVTERFRIHDVESRLDFERRAIELMPDDDAREQLKQTLFHDLKNAITREIPVIVQGLAGIPSGAPQSLGNDARNREKQRFVDEAGIRVYDGVTKECYGSGINFILKIEAHQGNYDLKDEDMVRLAVSKLAGKALSWWQTEHHPPARAMYWAHFRQIFLVRWAPENELILWARLSGPHRLQQDHPTLASLEGFRTDLEEVFSQLSTTANPAALNPTAQKNFAFGGLHPATRELLASLSPTFKSKDDVFLAAINVCLCIGQNRPTSVSGYPRTLYPSSSQGTSPLRLDSSERLPASGYRKPAFGSRVPFPGTGSAQAMSAGVREGDLSYNAIDPDLPDGVRALTDQHNADLDRACATGREADVPALTVAYRTVCESVRGRAMDGAALIATYHTVCQNVLDHIRHENSLPYSSGLG